MERAPRCHPPGKKYDEKIVEKGNPNSSYIYVEKPIVSGHTQINGVYSPVADKYSIVSFSFYPQNMFLYYQTLQNFDPVCG